MDTSEPSVTVVPPLYVHVRYALDVDSTYSAEILCGAAAINNSPVHNGLANHEYVTFPLVIKHNEKWCPECLTHPDYDLLKLDATEL